MLTLGNMTGARGEPHPDLAVIARRLGVQLRSFTEDGTGWRWRAAWRGVEIAAWNDIDGVAVIADIGPDREWVGLAGHPPDPDPAQALEWVVERLAPWLADRG